MTATMQRGLSRSSIMHSGVVNIFLFGMTEDTGQILAPVLVRRMPLYEHHWTQVYNICHYLTALSVAANQISVSRPFAKERPT